MLAVQSMRLSEHETGVNGGAFLQGERRSKCYLEKSRLGSLSGWRDSNEIATGAPRKPRDYIDWYISICVLEKEFIPDFKFQTWSWLLLISYGSVLIIRLSEQVRFPVPSSRIPTKSPLTQTDVGSDRGDELLLGWPDGCLSLATQDTPYLQRTGRKDFQG